MRLIYNWYTESEDKEAPEIVTSVSEIVDLDIIGIKHPEKYTVYGYNLKSGDVVVEAITANKDVIQVIMTRINATQLLLNMSEQACCDLGRYTTNIAFVNTSAFKDIPEASNADEVLKTDTQGDTEFFK